MKKDSLKGVLRALKQEDCVIFIGSGISMWSGLPSWTGMLNELADFLEECGEDNFLVKREIANGDLLQAASYGFDRLTKPQIGTFMTHACRYGEAKPHEIHQKILALGAKCFITTNYDKLIEMGIGKWREREFVNVITNRQLSEMGRLLQARATDFVYKPHGDIGDVESIILTREQYRSLLLNGERHMALETLKTLMVSRPIVYIGFGLRDPDFLYIRDILSNIYQGNVRDHYAIMADVEEAEIDYWRRNYGIHLIRYETKVEPDGTKSHVPLLELLELLNDGLHERDKRKPAKTQAEIVLALMRYASRFHGYTKAETEFGIRIHKEYKEEKYYVDKYNGSLVENFLEDGEECAILIGAPGAGKSYAMRRAAASMARKLNEKCLKENIDFSGMAIPVYIDLKIYDGDLRGMIEKEFSKTLSFETTIKKCKCKIFLDSFNEMPKEYWDNGKYRQDFTEVFAKLENAVFVISSRTTDGLEAYGFPVYYLDEIDSGTIAAELAKRGMTVKLNQVMHGIVSKPFYFQYIVNGKIDINNILHPKYFYREFFRNLQQDFMMRFAEKAEIEKILSAVAYRALDIGIEAFPVEFIYEEMNKQNIFAVMEEKEELVNWFIYKGIIIPHSNGKITYVHQTITEYLAAKKLMCLYLAEQGIINEKIRFYRWDQTIFFVMNLLSGDLLEEMINNLFKIDFGLVLRAVQYIEFPKKEISNRILNEIIQNEGLRYRYQQKIEKCLSYELQVWEENEDCIRDIIGLGDSIGGSAVFCLWRLKGDGIKPELMQLLLEHALDYNFCRNAIAIILSKMVEEADLEVLQKMIDAVQELALIEEEQIEKGNGFISAMAAILQKFSEERIRDMLIGNAGFAELSPIRKEIFCDFLHEKRTESGFGMAADLFMKGYKRASIAMYFIVCFSEDDLALDSIKKEHIDKLIDCFHDNVWALRTLREILKGRKDLHNYVRRKAKSYSGITRAAILSCLDRGNQEGVFEALESLLIMGEDELKTQSFSMLKDIELTWKDKEELFVKLLMLKNPALVSGLMGSAVPPSIREFGALEVENADWWLQWMEELENSSADNERKWQLLQIAGFLTKYMDSKSRTVFIKKFNEEDCKYRKILLRYVIPKLGACLDDFAENAITYIFEDLTERPYWGGWEHHFLARIADEQFIVERMIPLLNNADDILKNNLLDIINTAGSLLGKRYLIGIRSSLV